jgi:hypothetical protein
MSSWIEPSLALLVAASLTPVPRLRSAAFAVPSAIETNTSWYLRACSRTRQAFASRFQQPLLQAEHTNKEKKAAT